MLPHEKTLNCPQQDVAQNHEEEFLSLPMSARACPQLAHLTLQQLQTSELPVSSSPRQHSQQPAPWPGAPGSPNCDARSPWDLMVLGVGEDLGTGVPCGLQCWSKSCWWKPARV